CDNECTGQFLKPGNGSRKSLLATSLTTPCRPIARQSLRFGTTSSSFGTGNYSAAAREQGWSGRKWRNWPTSSSPSRVSYTLGPVCALPSNTRGRSRVPELGSLGSVRGALGNERPYRERSLRAEIDALLGFLQSDPGMENANNEAQERTHSAGPVRAGRASRVAGPLTEGTAGNAGRSPAARDRGGAGKRGGRR